MAAVLADLGVGRVPFVAGFGIEPVDPPAAPPDLGELEDSETWRFIVLGAVAAAMAVVAPRGLYGQIQKWRPLQFFPVRRRLVGPGVDGRR